MNQQPSTIQQPDNILSLAQTWFRDGVQRIGQTQVSRTSIKHPPSRALYERVKRIADQIEENGEPYSQFE